MHDLRCSATMKTMKRQKAETVNVSGLPPRYVPNSRRPLLKSWRLQLVITSFSVFLTILLTLVLLSMLVDTQQTETKLDIVKIALAAGAGAGGLVTLLLGVRRQLLEEQRADEARRDADERRVIDLYTRGVEQFGSERPEVRVGGLYALERLADENPDLREQVVDIVCVLLQSVSRSNRTRGRLPQDVEDKCLQLLLDHLAFESPYLYHKSYWGVGLLDLSGAHLRGRDFLAIKVDTMHFYATVFERGANFQGAKIRGADFGSAIFKGPATYIDAILGKGVFTRASFQSGANFTNVTFTIYANFADAQFAEPPDFTGSKISSRESDESSTTLPAGWKCSPSVDKDWLLIVPDSVAPADSH
jgi:uncharacterized protein YjbI with pentapeptide repeats